MTKSKKNHINDIRKTFEYVCKKANVDIKCCYFLRHSFWTAQKNLSTDAKMILGGWKSRVMVETYDKKTDKLKMEFRDQAAQTLLQYKSNR
jgi:integrase